VATALDGADDAVLQQLGSVQRALASLQRIDPTLERLQESYDAAFYALQEMARELDDYARRVDLDPARLADVERRRDLLYSLTKKYGPTLADVIDAGSRARAELMKRGIAGVATVERRSAVGARRHQACCSILAVASQRRISEPCAAVAPFCALHGGGFDETSARRDLRSAAVR